ncbi:family 10 glycosylhydrolase, partial [Escherichia coli]|uniref:family 10 glycosylhydrolase n=2 Tax=Bacteria TaxID=2 RepID=UPI00307AEEE1
MSSTDSQSFSSNKSSNEISLADWRRNNVNRLVSGIYKAIKENNPQVTFGISPAGNLDNLRNDLEYYVDIDTWVSQNGYVDYLMPQIYWGFTNE